MEVGIWRCVRSLAWQVLRSPVVRTVGMLLISMVLLVNIANSINGPPDESTHVSNLAGRDKLPQQQDLLEANQQLSQMQQAQLPQQQHLIPKAKAIHEEHIKQKELHLYDLEEEEFEQAKHELMQRELQQGQLEGQQQLDELMKEHKELEPKQHVKHIFPEKVAVDAEIHQQQKKPQPLPVKHPHNTPSPSNINMVVLLAYQRSGSSMMGQLFSSNLQAFYMYEPVDAIYSALYATTPGWNVPSDIFTHKNGSLRIIPRRELEAIRDSLSQLFQCNIDGLSTEMLIHDFWGLFSRYQSEVTASFRRCISQKKVTLGKCRKILYPTCPIRFGNKNEKQEHCGNAVNQGQLYEGKDKEVFERYHACLEEKRQEILPCIDLLKSTCDERAIRAVKTVRMSMDAAELLVERFPRLRVIHLIRDPRAVALSRMHTSSFRGLYAGDDPAREAATYCTAAARDMRVRQQMEKRFPGSSMQLVFEDFVSDPATKVKDVYSFLNLTLPNKVLAPWLEGGDTRGKNSTQVASRWQQEVSYATAKAIDKSCEEFYQRANYVFP